MASSPRCVVDTNVLISAGLSPQGVPSQVVEWIIEHGQLLASESTFAEFASRFIEREKFDRYVSRGQREAFVSLVSTEFEMVKVESVPAVSPDPDDDQFLALATAGHADAVVTGNTRDFPEQIGGVPVLTPAAFRDRFMST